ncbi:RsmB/NOP family class I SAM-dependent RNA methyltransferase [Jannaschia aquimarina]|uniref:RsmB protein n=1 Tax=Jannaschia aquimarina TaxID=935700 RepID=A0A0D1EII5_9RHOB|nr:RsmB/NOP family class I SAM-dependent RNA methyltransferase [Jannaschia aquimarina]KIT15660.1 Ribosomal RNA small subunit methyltransferase B [Jannaschia aquimarina]SNT03739.1 16S rRNA (cytosine967-C5)-methyltransferase [Jannaschia aquimarina]
MTPAARLQAAIDVLSPVLSGAPAERELTRWARGARYAGSKDRAAVRDHVFDALRMLRSSAWLGGLDDRPVEKMDAHAVVSGLLRQQGQEPETLFTGSGYAPPRPPPPGPPLEQAPEAVRLDVADWLLPRLCASLGDRTEPVCDALRHRAPVDLRVNLARTTREEVVRQLAADGHAAHAIDVSPSALRLDGPARGLNRLPAYQDGLFELQDAGSQTLVDRLPLQDGMRVLDLCAGGGGKTLAMAAAAKLEISAHDAIPERMRDLPARAARAGIEVDLVEDPSGPFDLVVCDVPCSGSGAWRRQPEAKWRLTPERLTELQSIQSDILRRASSLTRPGGTVAYMTCSLLRDENDAVVERSGLSVVSRWSTDPLAGTDGFFIALMHP